MEYDEVLRQVIPFDERSGEQLHAAHGLKVTGLHCGSILPEAPTQQYHFPTRSEDGSVSPQPFDIRCSVCMRYLGQHSQAVMATVGPRFGTVGRVVGVRNSQLYWVYDLDVGAVPVDADEEMCVLGRRPAELYRFPSDRSPPPHEVLQLPHGAWQLSRP